MNNVPLYRQDDGPHHNVPTLAYQQGVMQANNFGSQFPNHDASYPEALPIPYKSAQTHNMGLANRNQISHSTNQNQSTSNISSHQNASYRPGHNQSNNLGPQMQSQGSPPGGRDRNVGMTGQNPQQGWISKYPVQTPRLPPLKPINYSGVRFQDYPNHMATHVLQTAYKSGVRAEAEPTGRTPEDSTKSYPGDHELKFTGQIYREKSGYAENYGERDTKQSYSGTRSRYSNQATQPGPPYTRPHGPTAQRAGREFARYMDELNQEATSTETQRLYGDAFAGEPVLNIHPASPYEASQQFSPAPHLLSTLAIRRGAQPRTLLQETRRVSVGIQPSPIRPISFEGALSSQGPRKRACNGSLPSLSSEEWNEEISIDDSTRRSRSTASSIARRSRPASVIGGERRATANSSVVGVGGSRNTSARPNNRFEGKIFDDGSANSSRDQSRSRGVGLRDGRRLFEIFDAHRRSSPGASGNMEDLHEWPATAGR
jgi:hypothetical protein